MDPVSFASLTRRASLLTAGAAGLAALTRPVPTESKKRKKKKGDVNKLCKEEANACIAKKSPNCENMVDKQGCLARVQTCCSLLTTCDATGFLKCERDDAP